MNSELHIDDELLGLSIPSTEEEFENLEFRLLHAGCLEPILTWHGFILDGHKRYRICKDNRIDFNTIEIDYPTKGDVIAYICRKRIKELNELSMIYRYIAGKWYVALRSAAKEMRKKDGKKSWLSENTHWLERVSMIPAGELGVSYGAIEKYGKYAEIMDMVRQIDFELFNSVMSGNTHVPLEEIIKPTFNNEDRAMTICHKYSGNNAFRMRERKPHNNINTDDRKAKYTDKKSLSVGVKAMPVTDPDRELRGLTFTVPMWISSVSRAVEHTDLDKATDTAKSQLSDALLKLIVQINITLEELQ